MIYLEEYKYRFITIMYHTSGSTGTMKIRIADFLQEMTATKIRKLVKIIRESDTPDEMAVIVEYCTEWLKQYEPEQKILANRHVDARDKIKLYEQEVEVNTNCRSKFKRKSEHYEHFNELVKRSRENLKHFKAVASSSLNDFKQNERNKEKFLQVLEYINGQR